MTLFKIAHHIRLVLLPSVECRREAEKGAQADRHEQRAEDCHHGRQSQTPLGFNHVDFTWGVQEKKTLSERVLTHVQQQLGGCHQVLVSCEKDYSSNQHYLKKAITF